MIAATTYSPELASRHDDALSADAHGVALDVATRLRLAAPDFRDFRRRVRSQFPDQFAGAYIDPITKLYTVLFVGPPPTSALREAQGSGFAVEDDAALSLSNLNAIADGIRGGLVSGNPEEPHATAVDEEANAIIVYTGEPRNLVLGVASASFAAEGIEVEDVAEFVHLRDGNLDLFHGRGGNELLPDCRTGFAVRDRVSGTTGVLTAGHCENARNNFGSPARSKDRVGDAAVFDAPYVWQRIGGSGDVQFHSTPDHFDYGQFWADGKEMIFGAGEFLHQDDMVQYESVCTWSAVTPAQNRRCVPIRSTDFRAWYEPGQADGCPNGCHVESLVLMTSNLVYPSDSGGPWSQGSVVFGTTVGSVNGSSDVNGLDFSDSVFSAFSGIDSRVELLTGVHGQ